jgi:hypothetical protein
MAETITNIRIKSEGDKYTMEIVEAEGKTGDRLDQRVAQNILRMDENLRKPETMQMLNGFQQNPQAMLRSMMSRMMGGGMPGGMGGMGGMPGGWM